jgi:toxin ParE1/3/4
MIDAAIRPLADHPHLFRPGRVEGTREIVVHPNYIVVYRVLESRVDIVAVLHARRRSP